MQTSSLPILDSLKAKLLTFPALVDCMQNKDPDFLQFLERWMKETETILKNFNITECSEIAGLRSKIYSPLFTGSHGRSVRKKQLQIASELLYDLQKTILLVIKPHEIKVNEARDLLLQLLSILQQSGALKYSEDTGFQNFIYQIWNVFLTNEQLKPGTAKILSLVSRMDALRIIAEEINLEEWH